MTRSQRNSPRTLAAQAMALVDALDIALESAPASTRGIASDLAEVLNSLAVLVADLEHAEEVVTLRREVLTLGSVLEHAEEERPARFSGPVSDAMDTLYRHAAMVYHHVTGSALNSCMEYSPR